MSRRDEGLPYDLRCEEYKIFIHQSRGHLYKFLEDQQQEVWLVNERPCMWSCRNMCGMEKLLLNTAAPPGACCRDIVTVAVLMLSCVLWMMILITLEALLEQFVIWRLLLVMIF